MSQGFDLEDALHAKSTTPDHERDRCPECGTVKIHGRRSAIRGETNEPNYYCKSCGNEFDQPAQREPVTDGGVEAEQAPDYGFRTAVGQKIHYGRHCIHLQNAGREPQRVQLDQHPGWREHRCKDCWPGVDIDKPPVLEHRDSMVRTTVRLPQGQLDSMQELVERGVFPSVSEVIRDGIRKSLNEHTQEKPLWKQAQ